MGDLQLRLGFETGSMGALTSKVIDSAKAGRRMTHSDMGNGIDLRGRWRVPVKFVASHSPLAGWHDARVRYSREPLSGPYFPNRTAPCADRPALVGSVAECAARAVVS